MTEYLTDDQIISMAHGYYIEESWNENEFAIELIVSKYLKEREKIALRLRFYKGMSYVEIADIFDFKYAKVAQNLVHRALDSLKTEYFDYKRVIALVLKEVD